MEPKHERFEAPPASDGMTAEAVSPPAAMVQRVRITLTPEHLRNLQGLEPGEPDAPGRSLPDKMAVGFAATDVYNRAVFWGVLLLALLFILFA